ncbi:MAG: undecaprenyl/decaprenyl-phosphate alpha-N-acetylglucosaminyl 1-phosphate transferase [Phycisphaerae bacterium]|nr:undecaprenyl/decaprenyl-phosphate alpha-N-acetylglucosaminyl 1-phosphate transferase [Phycisphaerae bacterium]
MSRPVLLLLMSAAALGAAGLSALLTAAAVRICPRIGFTDHPGGHKSHKVPMPYGGGIAIFIAAWLPVAVAIVLLRWLGPDWGIERFGESVRPYIGGLEQRAGQALVLLIGAAVLHVLGLIDDVRALGAYPKLIVIAGVGLLVTLWGGLRIGAMWGDAISIPLTVAWFIVIVNAFNFLDNMDGLSSGVGWLCLVSLAACGLMAGQVFVPALACIFIGAVLGFWFFNFPPARIFMGDAGSLVVGYMLATTSVMTTYFRSGMDAPPYALAMPLVILAVPLYDFVSVVGIRLADGRNPMRGDQRHFSHRLVDHGLSRRFAVLTIYLATATTGLTATLLPGADLRRTLTVAFIVLMVLGIIAILESPARKTA